MEIKITIPIYFKKKKASTRETMAGLNWYRNAYYHELDKVKKEYHRMIRDLLKGYNKGFNKKIGISYRLFYRNDKSDLMNVASVIDKFFADSLQTSGLLENDNVKNYVISLSEVAGMDKKRPRVEITVTDDILGMLIEAYRRQKEI